MNIRTILFDLDGTLIDTNELIIDSFLHTFNTFGLHYSRNEVIAFNGPPLLETFGEIANDKAYEMLETYREHNIKNHDAYVKAFPHVVETIQLLYANNIKLGIVTTKMRDTAKRGLVITGLAPFFDVIVALDDVTEAKPHPEPVIRGMEALGGEPETTLMVGDNYHDIEAGKNANVQTAGVAWSLKGKTFLQQFAPTYMLEDIRDLLKILGV